MDFLTVMAKIVDFMDIKMNIYGFTFSFLDMLIWCLFASMVVWAVRELLL